MGRALVLRQRPPRDAPGGTFSGGNCSSGSDSATTIRRDAFGRITSVIEPGLEATGYTYDANDKTTSVQQGQARSYGYDAAGYLRSENTPEKGLVTYNDYGSLGNVLSETQPGSLVLTRGYDFAGRVKELRAGGVLYVSSSYDGGGLAGDLRLGKINQRVGYNPMAVPASQVIEDFNYSAVGGRLARKDVTTTGTPLSLGAVTETWGYNLLGLASSHSLPRRAGDPDLTATMQYSNGVAVGMTVGGQTVVSGAAYHPHGGLSRWTAGNTIVTTIAQDASLLPRPGAILGGAFSSGAYSYDGAGNIKAMGGNVFGYDLRSRLTSSTVSGQSLGYSYDRYGNRVGDADPASNRLFGGTYDARGNLTELGGQRYDYDALSRQTAYNGGYERYLYAGDGERVARLTSPISGADFFTLFPCRIFDTRDPNGPYGGPILSGGTSRTFTLIARCGIPANATGAVGNLTAVGASLEGFFRLYPTGTNPNNSTLNYTANRTLANNFSIALSGNGQISLVSSATKHAILDVTGYFAYQPPVWTLTYRDEASRFSSEYTVTTSAITRKKNYFYFGNQLVATRDSGGTFLYYTNDHLGTPRSVTGPGGVLYETHTYHPFGQEISGGFGNQPLKFAAMERDASSANDYVHARYLGSSQGRFLSPDLLTGDPADPQSWNRYAYARNNPVNRFDPDGLRD
ncbi:MAG: RHS repeat-associated core domain-containing protein, partial [Rubrobacteraceae bacterium]